MKKVIRFCDNCKKETKEYLKIMFFHSPTRLRNSKNYDLCNDCANKLIEKKIK